MHGYIVNGNSNNYNLIKEVKEEKNQNCQSPYYNNIIKHYNAWLCVV